MTKIEFTEEEIEKLRRVPRAACLPVLGGLGRVPGYIDDRRVRQPQSRV